MSTGPAHILLVEDNAGDARLLKELLTETGAGRLTLTHVDRLDAGIRCLTQAPFDIILLDLSLPDSQGAETLVRMHAAAQGIPIVLMTGFEDEELGLQLIQAGAQDYLVKGQTTAPLLARALKYAVERKRLEEELRQKTRFLQSVLDNMAEGVVMADERGTFQVWNQAAERIIGSGPADIGIEEWSKHYALFLPDRVTPFPTDDLPLAKAIRGESVTDALIFFRRPHWPDEAWLSVTARPLLDDTGHLSGGVAVFRDITAAKRTDEALRDSQERYRLLVTKANDIIYRTDASGRFTFVNPVAMRIMKYTEPELLGRRFIELIHPDHQPAAERFYGRQFLRKQSSTYYEFLALAKDGSEVWIGQNVQVLLEEGKVVGFQAVARDITDRRQAETALRDSEERFRAIMDNSPALIFIKDLAGRYLQANRQFEIISHLSHEDLVGKTDEEVFPPEQAAVFRGNDRKVLETGAPMRFEESALHDDGLHTSIVVKFPLRNSQNRCYALCGIATDITDRKRAEEARQQLAKDRLLLLESTGEGIYGIDRQGRCTFINSAAARLLGSLPEELLGQDMHERIHHSFPDGATYPRATCRIQETLEGGKGCKVHDEVYWRKDGTAFPVEYSSFPIIEDKQITGAVVVFLDITERKRAEQQLTLSHDQLRKLTARLESVREEERILIAREIHDELGQALTGVKLELCLLHDQIAEVSPLVRKKLESISTLVDGTIQSVQRIATELRPVVLDQLGLIPAIEWQAHEFQARTGIQCTLDVYLRAVTLSHAGSTAMFRIFQEILTNVARHAQASVVHITLQEQAGNLVLDVRDNGRGVTDAELADPHSLGLVGMRERALLLGGETIFTGSPGTGTAVRVRIPLDQP